MVLPFYYAMSFALVAHKNVSISIGLYSLRKRILNLLDIRVFFWKLQKKKPKTVLQMPLAACFPHFHKSCNSGENITGLYRNNHNLSNAKAELQKFSWVTLEKEGTELSMLMQKKKIHALILAISLRKNICVLEDMSLSLG